MGWNCIQRCASRACHPMLPFHTFLPCPHLGKSSRSSSLPQMPPACPPCSDSWVERLRLCMSGTYAMRANCKSRVPTANREHSTDTTPTPDLHGEVGHLVLGAIIRQQARPGRHNLWRRVGSEAGHLAAHAPRLGGAARPQRACGQQQTGNACGMACGESPAPDSCLKSEGSQPSRASTTSLLHCLFSLHAWAHASAESALMVDRASMA